MTDVVITAKDIVVEVEQPTTPPGATPPPKVGLVEINQIVQRGSIWFTGSGPPVNAGGQFGDLYLDVDTGDIYRWDGDSWEYQGTFAPSTLTAEEILAMLITVDGAGSLLDADFLDGHDSPYFATQAGLDANTAHDGVQDGLIAQNTADILQNASDIGDNEALVADLQADKVAKAGDTMTGPLNVVTPPTAPAHAASKAYVDSLTGAIIAAPPATVPPLMDGTAAVGTTTKYAREDHRHPSDTSKIGDAPNDGTQYVRKNLAWSPVVVPPGTVVSDTPPPAPLQGQMWFKSSTGVLYTWYTDPNSSAWIQVSASPQVVDQNYSRKTAERHSRIINGSMQVSQENGDTGSATLSASGSYYPADQWLVQVNTSGGIVTSRALGQTPYGSKYRIRVTVNTADTSLAAGEYAHLVHIIEGLGIEDLMWGWPTAKQVVIRFGFHGPAGTYAISLRNSAFNRAYVAPFTITAGQANTDTIQTFVIPGDTTGTWLIDNTIGLRFGITFAAATDAQTSGTGWQASSFLATTAITNNIGTAGNVFEIFDVAIYADPDKTGLAPPFEIEDYGTTLAKCKRYWQVMAFSQRGYATGGGQSFSSTVTFGAEFRTIPTVGPGSGGSANNATSEAVYPLTYAGGRYEVIAAGVGDCYALTLSHKLSARM